MIGEREERREGGKEGGREGGIKEEREGANMYESGLKDHEHVYRIYMYVCTKFRKLHVHMTL